ncbi:MAG: hypothetical protein ACOY15_07775 [Pseudomonadota bacterium]
MLAQEKMVDNGLSGLKKMYWLEFVGDPANIEVRGFFSGRDGPNG